MYYICVLPVAFPDFGFVQRERVVLAISFSLSPRESYRSTIFSFHSANDRKEKSPLRVHAGLIDVSKSGLKDLIFP